MLTSPKIRQNLQAVSILEIKELKIIIKSIKRKTLGKQASYLITIQCISRK